MNEPEQDPVVSAIHRLENASFAVLLATAAQIGTNHGDRRVIELYRTWIALQGGGGRQAHAAWFNLGTEWSHAGEPDNAILAYRTALALRPDFAPAAINLGLLLEQRGDAQAALACWAEALQTDSDRVALINQRARLLELAGNLAEAEATMRASLTIDHTQADVIRHWLHVRQLMCLWPVLTDAVRPLSPDDLLASCGQLTALALTDKITIQAAIAGAWIQRGIPPAPERLAPEQGYQHDRIRLGYLSSDFRDHAMSHPLVEMLERHDRARFEVHLYCATPEEGGDMRQRMISACDHFTVIKDMSDAAAARAIRADEIDILIDLNGLSTGGRRAILRWRPAQVQATYLGFIGPVPMPELDFLLCDEFVVPPVYAVLYDPAPAPVPVTREAAGLPEDRFVFCCFSGHEKITETMFGAWMEILRRVEGSVLWLIDGNRWSRDNLRMRATIAGLDPARLLFAGQSDPAETRARLALADLFLDTAPYNAGAIASDAVRAGLPIVTLRGESIASQTAGRLLQAIGATPGITETIDVYMDTAITLATEPELLARYRTFFTAANASATIGDIATFTRHYEQSLIGINAAVHERNATEPEPSAEFAEEPDLVEAAAA